MYIKSIKNEIDYREALCEIDKLLMAESNTYEGDMLDIMVTLVESYEAINYQIDS